MMNRIYGDDHFRRVSRRAGGKVYMVHEKARCRKCRALDDKSLIE